MKRLIVILVAIVLMAPVMTQAQEETPELVGKLAYIDRDRHCVVVLDLVTNETSECVTLEYSYDPAWSPDGSKLAFVQSTDTSSNIFVLDYASGTVTQLTQGEHWWRAPAWSPDGTQIAFMALDLVEGASKETWLTALKVLNVDGGAVSTLVKAHIGARYTGGAGAELVHVDTMKFAPAWSPDGARIAYTGEAFGPVRRGTTWVPTDHILAAAVEYPGQEPIDLTPIKASDFLAFLNSTPTFVMPAWSPDGAWIAFSASGLGYSYPDVYVINVGEGLGSIMPITDHAGAQYPCWSPDGAWIAYNTPAEIFVSPSGLSRESPIFLAYGTDPSWSW